MIRLLATALLLCVPAALSAQLTDTQAMDAGRRYVQFFTAGQADSLAAVMTPEAMARIGGLKGIAERSQLFTSQLGTEVTLLKEDLVRDGTTVGYRRLARYSAMQAPMLIRWNLDAQGKIVSGEMTNDLPD